MTEHKIHIRNKHITIAPTIQKLNKQELFGEH